MTQLYTNAHTTQYNSKPVVMFIRNLSTETFQIGNYIFGLLISIR